MLKWMDHEFEVAWATTEKRVPAWGTEEKKKKEEKKGASDLIQANHLC